MAVSDVQPETFTQLWEQVLEAVRSRLGSQQAYETWFRPVVPRHLSAQIVELEVPSSFFSDGWRRIGRKVMVSPTLSTKRSSPASRRI